MTFKDLKQRITINQSIQQQQQVQLFTKLKNKPFCIWNIEKHKLQDLKTNGGCCFNHIIRLPTKDGID
jgi:hypothetical protein